jgi:hypothetical protein
MQVIAFDCVLLIFFNLYFELCELILTPPSPPPTLCVMNMELSWSSFKFFLKMTRTKGLKNPKN